MKNINDILSFYRIKKRIIFLIILFILILITSLLIDIQTNRYPPQVGFIDNDNFIKGDIYLDNEYVGTIKEATFDNLPDDYCKGTHIISLDTEQEGFSWPTDPSHCTTNMVKFYTTR